MRQQFIYEHDETIPKNLVCNGEIVIFIVSELTRNAIKYTPTNGTITLTISYDSLRAVLIISVKDNGIGISPFDQEKIFKLGQIDSSSTRRGDGIGLGLATIAEIAAKLNGRISLESQLGEGSLFQFFLPAYAKMES